jgi:hypothetical protein
MTSKLCGGVCGTFLLLASGCNLEHHAPLRSAELPALAPSVLHANRLWIEVAERMPENDCVAPGNARLLCFERLRSTVGTALTRSLWSSFPGVDLLDSKSAPSGDYVRAWSGTVRPWPASRLHRVRAPSSPMALRSGSAQAK